MRPNPPLRLSALRPPPSRRSPTAELSARALCRLAGYAALLVLVRVVTGRAPPFHSFPHSCATDKVGTPVVPLSAPAFARTHCPHSDTCTDSSHGCRHAFQGCFEFSVNER